MTVSRVIDLLLFVFIHTVVVIIMATPGMIGSIDQYQRHKSFTHYVERFEVMCKLNKVNAETKQSWFISVSGDEVFEEIKLIFPKKRCL